MLRSDPPVQYAAEPDMSKLFSRPNPPTPELSRAAAPVPHPAFPLDPIGMCEAWLQASRRVMDFWRVTVRDQQDAMYSSWRAQLHRPHPAPEAAAKDAQRKTGGA